VVVTVRNRCPSSLELVGCARTLPQRRPAALADLRARSRTSALRHASRGKTGDWATKGKFASLVVPVLLGLLVACCDALPPERTVCAGGIDPSWCKATSESVKGGFTGFDEAPVMAILPLVPPPQEWPDDAKTFLVVIPPGPGTSDNPFRPPTLLVTFIPAEGVDVQYWETTWGPLPDGILAELREIGIPTD